MERKLTLREFVLEKLFESTLAEIDLGILVSKILILSNYRQNRNGQTSEKGLFRVTATSMLQREGIFSVEDVEADFVFFYFDLIEKTEACSGLRRKKKRL